MEEKRKIGRRYLLYYMRVYNAKTREQIGNLVDITPQGIMILSESIIPPGTTLRLQLELSDDISDKPYIEIPVRSKWCKPDINPRTNDVGFEILELSAEDAKIVQRVVQSYGFRDNKPKK
jgi:PilZ domain